MNGMEVLNTIEVVTKYSFSWTDFWIAFIFSIVIGGVIGAILAIAEGDIFPLLAAVALGLGFGVFFGWCAGESSERYPIEYETQYQVTLTDEVSMVDFLERYEIIEQSGKILTVREKGETNGL